MNDNKSKICTNCNVNKPLDEFYKAKSGLYDKSAQCKECVSKKRKDLTKLRNISMYDNKDCPVFLGVVIGERLCHHLFKDVEVMPNGNHGYDIICNKGKLIDVKTSCICLNSDKNPQWHFTIKKNKICDYFICIAFDNRTNLNPLHMWMIPGNEINDKTGISITQTKIHKWDKWKRNIDDAQLCCTEMKNY